MIWTAHEAAKLSAGRILIAVVLVLALEANYRYYDFKGKAPLVSLTFIYNSLPDGIRSIAWAAGKTWAVVTGRRTPVTLLPDHVMLCIPNSLALALENPAPGSPEELYRQQPRQRIFHGLPAGRQECDAG